MKVLTNTIIFLIMSIGLTTMYSIKQQEENKFDFKKACIHIDFNEISKLLKDIDMNTYNIILKPFLLTNNEYITINNKAYHFTKFLPKGIKNENI